MKNGGKKLKRGERNESKTGTASERKMKQNMERVEEKSDYLEKETSEKDEV